MKKGIWGLGLVFFSILLGLTGGFVAEAAYPDRPIEIIVPFGVGGGSDTAVRAVAEGLKPLLKAPLLITNMPGGGATKGMLHVSMQPADGYTLLAVTTSHLIDAVARKHGIPVFETPVGFKYVGELISQDKIVIGGEESAGLSVKGHVPEKDGILACFLVAEMVAREGKTIRELLERLYGEVGRFITRRDNLKLSPQLESEYAKRITTLPAEVAGTRIKEVIRIDGTKLLLEDGSWILFRKSGTEPVVRLYGEAATEARLAEVMAAGRKFIAG